MIPFIFQLLMLVAVVSLPSPARAQQKAPEFRISDVLFEDYSGAPSPRWQMKPGEEVVMSFRIEGFGRIEDVKDGMQEDRVNLHYRIELLDPQGVPVVPERTGEIETTLGLQDKDWRPKVNWSARVPSSAPGGNYTVRIQASDAVAQHDVTKDVPIRVVAPLQNTVESIEVQSIEYATSERGPWSRERYFAPSETVWVRYQIVGYGISQDKKVWVEQDWTVLDSAGKVVLTQTHASDRQEQGFYPPRFLPTSFTVKLKDPKPGRYTLRIEVRDRIRDQSATFDSTFNLRE